MSNNIFVDIREQTDTQDINSLAKGYFQVKHLIEEGKKCIAWYNQSIYAWMTKRGWKYYYDKETKIHIRVDEIEKIDIDMQKLKVILKKSEIEFALRKRKETLVTLRYGNENVRRTTNVVPKRREETGP